MVGLASKTARHCSSIPCRACSARLRSVCGHWLLPSPHSRWYRFLPPHEPPASARYESASSIGRENRRVRLLRRGEHGEERIGDVGLVPASVRRAPAVLDQYCQLAVPDRAECNVVHFRLYFTMPMDLWSIVMATAITTSAPYAFGSYAGAMPAGRLTKSAGRPRWRPRSRPRSGARSLSAWHYRRELPPLHP